MRTVSALTLVVLLGCQPDAPALPAVPASLSNELGADTTVLAGPEEPGERLVFEGRVLDAAGQPVARATVDAWQTDAEGLYNDPDAGTREPRLSASAVTGADGAFRFVTIRPGTYPSRTEPAHIHIGVRVPGRDVHWVAYWFSDDPLLDDEAQQRRAERTGEIVIVEPVRGEDGVWRFRHDIHLEGS